MFGNLLCMQVVRVLAPVIIPEKSIKILFGLMGSPRVALMTRLWSPSWNLKDLGYSVTVHNQERFKHPVNTDKVDA